MLCTFDFWGLIKVPNTVSFMAGLKQMAHYSYYKSIARWSLSKINAHIKLLHKKNVVAININYVLSRSPLLKICLWLSKKNSSLTHPNMS